MSHSPRTPAAGTTPVIEPASRSSPADASFHQPGHRCPGGDQTPDGPVWLPLGSQDPRLSLIDLAAPIPPQAIERASLSDRLAEEGRQRRGELERKWARWRQGDPLEAP